jgi:hypothetical protein
MTQYLLSLPHDTEESPTMESMDPVDLERVMAAVGEFNKDLQDAGVWVFAGGLHPPSTATTVDNTAESPTMDDGPLIEFDSYLGGLWIIDVADIDSALEWAKRGSRAVQSAIEVRAFQEAPQ